MPAIAPTDYRGRLERFYKHYAPEKASNIDNLLSKYKGKEETMFEELTKRYGPETNATNITSSNTKPSSSSSSKTGGSGAGGSKKAPASDGNTKPSAPAGETSDAAKTPKAGAGGGGDDAPPPPTTTTTTPKTTAASEQSGGGDSVALTSSSNQEQQQQESTDVNKVEEEEDVEDQLRNLVSKSGFLCQEHEHKWVQVWLGSLPLQLLTREVVPGRNPVIIQAWGYKHVRKSPIGSPWKRRFLIVVPPFLYYADSDKPGEKCRGCIYLARATIREEKEKDGKTALTIESKVNRRPDALDSSGDAAAFMISFETERVMETWHTVLTKVAAAPYNLTTGLIETKHQHQQQGLLGLTPTSAANSGAVLGPYGLLASPRSGGALSPQSSMKFDAFSACGGGAGGYEGAGGFGAVPLQGALSGAITPPAAGTSVGGAAGASGELASIQQQLQMLAQQQQQLAQQQQQLAQQQQASSSPPSAMAASRAMAATTPSPAVQQPQPPSQADVVLPSSSPQQQQHYTNGGTSASPGAAASTSTTSSSIDIQELLKRTKRVAAQRDPQAVIEILFKHVDEHPGDAGVIWHMMLALDDAPAKPTMTAAPPPAPAPVPRHVSPPRQGANAAAAAPRGASETPSEFFSGNNGKPVAGVDSRSASYELAPLPNSSFAASPVGVMGGNNSSSSGQNDTDAVKSALKKSKDRRAAIDQMLSSIPK